MIPRLAALFLLVTTMPTALFETEACAQESSVRVVVSTSDADHRVFCVDADVEDGLQALEGTGLQVVSRDFGPELGAAVCSIDGVGSSLSDCPGSTGHWHFWIYRDGGWSEAQRGAGAELTPPGTVHGWVWTEGAVNRPPGDPTGPCVEATGRQRQAETVPWFWIVATSVGLLAVAALVGRRRAR